MRPGTSRSAGRDRLGVAEGRCGPRRWPSTAIRAGAKAGAGIAAAGGAAAGGAAGTLSLRLLVFLLVLTAGSALRPDRALAAPADHRFALVVGNNHYGHLDPDRQLLKAANDANAVGDALERDGFKVLRGTDFSRTQIVDKLYELSDLVQPGDTALFYFAGHGISLGSGNYILPSDVPDIEQGQEQRLANQAISEADIIAALQGNRPRVTMVILDSCRDNPFKKPGLRSVGLGRGLGHAPDATGVFSLYSAGYSQSALDRLSDADPNPNSVFTRVLVPLLTRPGLNLDDLAYEVREQVSALAATTPDHHPQTPASYNQITGGRIYLVPASEATAAPAPRVEAAAPERPADAAPKPAPAAPPPPASPPPAQVASLEASPTRTVSDPIYLREIADRLFDQGFDPGDAESSAMVSAIHGFEDRAGLPRTDRPTPQLLDALRDTKPPAPWGALAFGPRAKRYGLTWGKPSRREALAQARLHCGTADCTQVVSFAGKRCGVLAASSASYFMAWRDDMDHARDDALKQCGARGSACRVVGAVCADGSGRAAGLKPE